MAATNYTPIQLYRTTTLAAAPVSGNLTSGELAINVNDADMALYAKNNTGNVKRLMNNPAGLKYPTADGTANQVIKTDGAGTLSFSTPTTGTVTSVGGTGTVSGITLTGTVTSSGSLTLGGTLSLASPPTIGNTTANTGAFTTLSASGQLTLTKATNYNLYASGAGNNYMAGSLGIGNTTLTNFNLNVQKNLTGSTTATNISSTPNIQSDVTAQADGYSTFISTATAAFTLTGLTHYRSSQGPFGAGSTVAIQRGFFAQSDLIGATNNYGFHSNIPAGTGRYNLYMSGTADNYLAGNLTVANSITISGAFALRGSYGAGAITSNFAAGDNALLSNTTGINNSAVGVQALQDLATTTIAATAIVNGTAYQIVTMGTTTSAQWIASGAVTGKVGETFTANATAGVGTGTVATSANIATQCLNNTALGRSSGRGITTGSGNTILGANVTGLAAGLTNNVIIANGTGSIRVQSNATTITFADVILPPQAVTASAPAYVKGGMYFDTTLNKMRIGGATAWETVTSV